MNMNNDFKDMINTVPQMIWKVFCKNDEIIPIYFNKSWLSYIGNKNFLDKSTIHPDDYDITYDTWKLSQKNLIFQIHIRLKNTNNEYNWFLIRSINKNNYWYGTCTDINEIQKYNMDSFNNNKKIITIDPEHLKLDNNILDELNINKNIINKELYSKIIELNNIIILKNKFNNDIFNNLKNNEILNKIKNNEKINKEILQILDNMIIEKLDKNLNDDDEIVIQENNIEKLKKDSEYLNKKIIDKEDEIFFKKSKFLIDNKNNEEEFLSFISHEIRNPIYSISNMVDFLKDSNLNNDQLELVNIQQESCNNILYLLNNILNERKLSLGKMELEYMPLNINNLIKKTINIYKNQIESKGLKLIVKLSLFNNELYGDYYKISQILSNLINNAIKFTDNGSITISCIINNIENNKYNINIYVIDTGIGIKKDELNKLFKEFSQTNSSIQQKYGGSGLGLNICEKLVKLMNGSIGVESEYEKGSNFYFNLILLDHK